VKDLGVEIPQDRRVHVYRNLHMPGYFSIRRDGKVITHREIIVLHHCRFHVQPGGHKRAIESGVKNVHAYVSGFVTNTFKWPSEDSRRRVTYRPPDGPHFYCDGEPIREASIAWMSEGRFVYIR
jgi:hypothetical protein